MALSLYNRVFSPLGELANQFDDGEAHECPRDGQKGTGTLRPRAARDNSQTLVAGAKLATKALWGSA